MGRSTLGCPRFALWVIAGEEGTEKKEGGALEGPRQIGPGHYGRWVGIILWWDAVG